MPPRRRTTTPSVARQHADWISLLRPDGPFISVKVLAEALPQGLATVPDTKLERLVQAWDEVQAAPGELNSAWQGFVLGELLGLTGPLLAEGPNLPDGVRAYGPGDTRVRPDAVAFGPDGAGGRAERLHVYRRGWREPLTKATKDHRSAVEEAADLCRRRGVPLALLTNGQLWILVHARVQEASTVAVFDADLWLEERDLLRAFATLLAATRVLKPSVGADGTPTDSLAALFARSAAAQAEVTTTLGRQVLRAVELLVGELSRLDRESGGELLAYVPERRVYQGALTVMMRLVFLLYAEDQRLLPVDAELYASSYSVGGLFDELEEAESRYGDVIVDRRQAAWPRLIALFGAVYGGCEHDDLRIPPYGGTLFDPERFPWLAGMKVTDRVVQKILRALLLLVGESGAPERLSYKGLNVEQIGHVYEGLLEFSCLRVAEPYVGLFGKAEPELPLAELERARREEPDFAAWLVRTCETTANRVTKALAVEPKPTDRERLRTACENDDALTERVLPFLGLLRQDLRGWPTVFPAGSLVITQVGDRRATGTHYTPRRLAEEVVEHTLAPLCFSPGPAEGAEPGVWRAKRWDELLKLKVLDPAMGSGAFLVSACRYIADRIVDDWERNGVPGEILDAVGPDYDRDGLLLEARRRVAASCIYGVDRDEQAVELAKLSLWLVTLAKDKPFSFLDHALRCGDSLIGVVDDRQLQAFHLDPTAGDFQNSRLSNTLGETVETILAEAERLRVLIEQEPVRDAAHGRELEAKLTTVEALTERLRFAADAVVAAALAAADAKKQNRRPHWEEQENADEYGRLLFDLAEDVEKVLLPLARAIALAGDPSEESYGTRLAELVADPWSVEDGELHRAAIEAEEAEKRIRGLVEPMLTGGGRRPEPIRPLHWPLEFPEVMRHGGFSAVVGNPPFIGGQRLTGSIGEDVREFLVTYVAEGRRGSADLCAYFLLRNLEVAPVGRVGIIATNTISQGDTREVGLDQAYERGWRVYRTVKSQPWPGTASLEVSLVWAGHPGDREPRVRDGQEVPSVTSSLDPEGRMEGQPYRLTANAGQSFIGSYVLGLGFIMAPEEAAVLIEADPRNKEVLFPYLNGEDLNSRPDCSGRRWVINFRDWPIERAKEYVEPFAIVDREVKPFREKNNRKVYRDYWWQYGEKRPAMQEAIAGLERVLVITLVSRLVMPAFVSAQQVIAHKIAVFATDRSADLALLSSVFHNQWAWKYSSTMKADLNYSPSDVYDTFPQPTRTERMDTAGTELHEVRSKLMLERDLGLTKLYNLVNDPAEADPMIQRIRELHVEIDEAVREAYALDEERESAIRDYEARKAKAPLPAWPVVVLDHGFHDHGQGVRWTVGPQARLDILDKLLVLNHYRHKEEPQTGVRKPKKTTRQRTATGHTTVPASPAASAEGRTEAPDAAEGESASFLDDGIFPPDGALF
ncbi:Eco57I restriction-modification methylase domain-containing protein [Sphaerimonospora mesophila]|uniref:Eco57I restriction-modification methylase domain-containing protein n=1 Tax=Sphaerimonospora mesophila TaxID=37483 RepID=UPI0006E153DD